MRWEEMGLRVDREGARRCVCVCVCVYADFCVCSLYTL